MTMPMAVRATGHDGHEPATLHRTIQRVIGEDLKACYRPPETLSHELFVLLLQIKERERRAKPEPERRAKTARRSAPRKEVTASA